MSFILDALKRSERARRVLGAAQAAPPSDAVGAGATRVGVVLAVAALLLANGALLAWLLWRDGDAAPATAPATLAAPTQAAGVRPLAREAGAGGARTDAAPARLDAPDGATAGVATPAEARVPALALADAGPTLQARLAPLHLDAHGWADDPAQRFVLVNLKRRAVGETLAAGVTLVEIVPEGAVVEVDGHRVLLPRQ